MIKTLNISSNAFRHLATILKVKYNLYYQHNIFNRGRHAIFYPPRGVSSPKFYVLFRKDFFNSFGKIYDEFNGMVGDSINVEWLNLAIEEGVDYILFVYNNGSVYKATPMQIKLFCEKHNTIRVQDTTNCYKEGGKVISVREETYSFPLTLLEGL